MRMLPRSAVGVLVASLAAIGAEFARAQPRADLHGRVVESGDRPVADATVYVWTAGVRKGYSSYCPSCYPDCGKSASTAPDGTFSIPSLDSDLVFRLLVVHDGFAPAFAPGIDPIKDEQVRVTIARRPVGQASPARSVRGVVVGPDGIPLAGAAVAPQTIYWTDEHGQLAGIGGSVDGLDPLAVTNSKGEFELVYSVRDTTHWDLQVEARGFSARNFEWLASGHDPHRLALTRGATIKGRLVKDGRPVPQALMGLVQTDRSSRTWMGRHSIGTGTDGSFVFTNIPVGHRWYVYATMDSIAELGSTVPVIVSPDTDETIVDAGDISIRPGFVVSGRVVLSDGRQVPEGMRIALSLEHAWDSQTQELPGDGTFRFTGVPRGDVSITPSIKGYRLSRRNPSLSWAIEGAVTQDVEDLVILVEPGKEDLKGLVGGKNRGKPLRSIDPALLPDHARK